MSEESDHGSFNNIPPGDRPRLLTERRAAEKFIFPYLILLFLTFSILLVLILENTPNQTPPLTKVPEEYICKTHHFQTCLIYCCGPILEMVELHSTRFFNDSKDFIDMPMKFEPLTIIQNFQLKLENKGNLTANEISDFISENFDVASDVVEAEFTDFSPSPGTLLEIKDAVLREYAVDIHQLWNLLGRKMVDDVYDHPSRHSILGLKHNIMLVPGGRFREVYYWDSYFILKGLLASEMHETARMITENLLNSIEKYGFVPNGNRIYYENRSQPPLLTFMVQEVYKTLAPSIAKQWLREAVKLLSTEYDWWMLNDEHSVLIEIDSEDSPVRLNRYYANMTVPRPEMYREDLNLAKHWQVVKNQTNAYELYSNLVAGAETGWDYSSRWFSNYTSKENIHVMNLAPVELNVILCNVERVLAELYSELGDDDAAEAYRLKREDRILSMWYVFWNEEEQQWFDYDILGSGMRWHYSISNFLPLWGNCMHSDVNVTKVVAALNSSGLIGVGGVLTTVYDSGQQWDAPNVWAPLNALVAEGLLYVL